ncbi:MAG: heme lyase CcmF/NrfE family subunit [Pseudomonadota bacterium]|nr:heme lyase CcmF/NrfE family subunit [Pseudomonadota bacterium]MEC7830197.1 heme lyase CcmF/NrfE family subunit [Pseudomonadota bacterium]MEC9382714.1 heme lyase CcmF/NrfE family subunit [Pseudomonadota bacterium]
MLSQFGNFFIALALSASFLQALFFLLGKLYKKSSNLISTLTIIHFISISLAFFILLYGFIVSDFSIQNVWENSHTLKPMIYKITGSWASHEGSMLLWCWVMALYGFIISINYQSLNSVTKSLILMSQGILSLGFTIYLFFLSNPLKENKIIAVEGNGLNPLLQDPGLAFHPPFLYLGYVGLSIVWSFALAGLIRKSIDQEWAKNLRAWALISWIFLTIGIALGSWWAYYELGWGGYWFWDPVENVSLIPWIVSTALLHNLLALEKKHILINWSVLLSFLGFILSIIGTFLVRSGLITSVHAFASDPARGIFILLLLALITTISLTVYAKNYNLKEKSLELNFLSKEVFLIINNLLLTIIGFTVFLGTIYPLIIETFTDDRISVGPPFYNITVIPFAIFLAFFSAVGPALAWNKNESLNVITGLILPILITLFALVLMFSLTSKVSLLFIIGFVSAVWLLSNSFKNIINYRLVGLNNWASFLAHSGFAVIILGISFSSSFQQEFEDKLNTQSKIKFSGYELVFNGISKQIEENYVSTKGDFYLIKNGKKENLYPEKRFYPIEQSFTTEAAIVNDNFTQLYLVLGEKIDEDSWIIRIWYKPMITLIWLGGLLMAIGGLLSFIKRFKKTSITKISLIFLIFFAPLAVYSQDLSPALEKRIHDINLQVRCMVCQSQTIDDSDAPLAKDLRALIRQKVIEGQTDDQIFGYLRSKYGDYILMKPRLKMNTYFLWFSPIVVLIIGLLIIFKFFNIRFRSD